MTDRYMAQEYKLSVITVNYNGLEDTCSLLASLPHDDPDMELIVVDNASARDEAAEISARCPYAHVIRNSVNSGFAGGNNVGIRASHGRYVLLINNDAVIGGNDTDINTNDAVTEGNNAAGGGNGTDININNAAGGRSNAVGEEKSTTVIKKISAVIGEISAVIGDNDSVSGGNVARRGLDALMDRLASSETIGIVCPKIRYYYGAREIQYAGYTPLSGITLRNRAIGNGEADSGQYDTPHPTPYAHGAAMMLSRAAIDAVGLLPECFFLYYEELDYSMMMRRAGYEIWYEPACTVYHKESRTTGADSPLRAFYMTRNRLLFTRRNVRAPQRYVSYLYLAVLVAARDVLRALLRRRAELAAATVRGVLSFIFKKS